MAVTVVLLEQGVSCIKQVDYGLRVIRQLHELLSAQVRVIFVAIFRYVSGDGLEDLGGHIQRFEVRKLCGR